jgi:hypothetical protein
MTLSEIFEPSDMSEDSPTKHRFKEQLSPILAPDKITQSTILLFTPMETLLESEELWIEERELKFISEYQLSPLTIPREYFLLEIQTLVASKKEEGVPASTK